MVRRRKIVSFNRDDLTGVTQDGSAALESRLLRMKTDIGGKYRPCLVSNIGLIADEQS